MADPRDVRYDGNKYPVVEIFTSVQTEGARCGTLTHFLRLAGCNLHCPFCDTDLNKFEMRTPNEIMNRLCDLEWKQRTACRLVITGGEPMVHDLWPLLTFLGSRFKIAMESNGTLLGKVAKDQPEVLRWIDWLTISPKTRIPTHLLAVHAAEVKFIVPDHESLLIDNEELLLSIVKGKPHVFVQPEFNNPDSVKRCLEFMSVYPRLRMSIQSHKYLGLR